MLFTLAVVTSVVLVPLGLLASVGLHKYAQPRRHALMAASAVVGLSPIATVSQAATGTRGPLLWLAALPAAAMAFAAVTAPRAVGGAMATPGQLVRTGVLAVVVFAVLGLLMLLAPLR